MSTALTLPIARLRAAGCKVSTLFGHDPAIGDFIYGVTLPKGIPPHYELRLGGATLLSHPNERSATIRSCRYHPRQPLPDKQERNAAGVEAARLLESLADHVENYDQAGSASRQHYIETGRYLTFPEDAGTSYTQADVIGVRFVRTTHEDTVRVVDLLLDAAGHVVEGGSSEYDLYDCRLHEVVDFHTKQIEG